MKGGRLRAMLGLVRKGRETFDGTGQALRDAFPNPMEAEADEAMLRCIEQLNQVEGTLKGRLGNADD